MTSLFRDISLEKLNLYVLHVLVFLISFQERLIPVTLVIFLVLNLFSVPFSERQRLFKKRKLYIFSFTLFYVVTLMGMLYTIDIPEGLFDLEVKMSMLFVPLLFLTSNIINRFSVYGLLKTFIWGVTLSLVIQFIIAGFNFTDTGNPDVFFYTLLSLFHHPSYFSMYVNFAIASLLVLIFHSRNRPQFRHFALLGFLMIGVYQLSSRTGMLTLVLLLLYAFVYIFFPELKWKKMLYSLFATLLLLMAVIYPITKYTNSFRKVDVVSSKSSSGVRMSMWKSSIPLIKENLLLGVGTGDVNWELRKRFSQDRLVRAVRDNLNAHNQFIQTQVGLGLLGTFALLISLFIPLWFSVKKGKLFFPLFLLILLINFLTESVLNTQAGVVYYAVMNSIVFFTYEN
ncbi:O-antigen ligase family protein [bacterium SCSIO 12643]|nr:O-antigen ligase family protein [bacterium SCSIO 12643]